MKKSPNLIERIANWLQSPIIIEAKQRSVTIGANTGTDVMETPAKTGYIPVAIVGVRISGDGSGTAEVRQWRIEDGTTHVYIYNNGAQKTWTIWTQVLYLKDISWGGVLQRSILKAFSHFLVREEVVV